MSFSRNRAWLLGLLWMCGCSIEAADEHEPGEAASLDPLSMPAEPTLSPSQFNSAQICAGCHPNHYAEWQLSRHSRAMRDPVYRALVAIRQHELAGVEDQFCTQCHSAICTRGGECGPMFSFEALSPIALEGVTCEACHKVSAVVRPFNAGHELDPGGPIRGPIHDPVSNGFHDSQPSALFDEALFCGGCHDVIETSGLVLEQPYAEWLGSPANPEQPCQRCHMPTYSGTAAIGGPARDDVHRHRFVGVDLPMEGDVDAATLAELDAEIEALLAGAATVELDLPESVKPGKTLELEVALHNRIAGHAFPTGSTFLRQVWLELTVTDGQGEIVYATGQLDAAGDLVDEPDLITLGSELRNHHGARELFSWRATEHHSNALAPMQRRTHALAVALPKPLVGPLRVDATLHFRSYPPALLRMLGLPELVELAVVRDVASASGEVAVGG